MSFTSDLFNERMNELFVLRGWRISHKDRFSVIFDDYYLHKFHRDDLEYAVRRLKQDDSFDERTMMFYMRESRSNRNPEERNETMAQYEKRMMMEVGPHWRDVAKKCWKFIGDCMSGFDERNKYIQGGRRMDIESVDYKKFHQEMAEEYPDIFGGKI
jgi:hypothetical protein